MPSKRKQPFGARPVPELNIPAALLDRRVKGPMTEEEVEAVCRSLKKAVIQRAMRGRDDPSPRLLAGRDEASLHEVSGPPCTSIDAPAPRRGVC